LKRDLLHRVYMSEKGVETRQLVVSQPLHKGALALAHKSVMAGHLGGDKTLRRLTSQCWCPDVCADVSRFVRPCDRCQKTTPKGRVPKAPLQKMPVDTFSKGWNRPRRAD